MEDIAFVTADSQKIGEAMLITLLDKNHFQQILIAY
jgi:hypothetical protein